jgi:hypothetical protein
MVALCLVVAKLPGWRGSLSDFACGAAPIAISAIYVCNLIEMPGYAAALGASHLVSLVASNEQPPTPAPIIGDRDHRVARSEPRDPRSRPFRQGPQLQDRNE